MENTLTHDFRFRTVHPSLDDDTNETPFVSTHHSMATALVDYIFVSRDKVSSKNQTQLKCLSYIRLPNANEIDKIGLLPNDLIGSDHLSLTGQFVIEPSD